MLRRTVLQNPWIPHTPTERQALFLSLPVLEAFYGGAAGGGKSDALLMAALQFVDVPGYQALLLRRTYADLSLPGALMDRAHDWLGGTAAHWSDTEKTWTFPSGATLTFGYLDHERAKYRYQGSDFQFIGWDELTQFSRGQYTYLMSRLRRLTGVSIPLRVRSASNPGGAGHEWVYERFIVTGRRAGRVFVPARLDDNPHLDRDEYRRSLAELDPLTRKQLLDGLWVVDPTSRSFQRDWWRQKSRFDPADPGVDAAAVARYLSWDTALKDGAGNAYSALTVGEIDANYRLRVREVWRERLIFPDLLTAIERTARQHNRDGKLAGILIEDKASGTSAYQTLSAAAPPWLARLLIPFAPQGDKPTRAQQAAVWCKLGAVELPHPSPVVPWLATFEDELFSFPDSEFADQVDSFVQLIIYLEHYLAQGYHARTGS